MNRPPRAIQALPVALFPPFPPAYVLCIMSETTIPPPAYHSDPNPNVRLLAPRLSTNSSPTGINHTSELSAALLTLQLQHANPILIANANRLLSARFQACAIHEERNVHVLVQRFQLSMVCLFCSDLYALVTHGPALDVIGYAVNTVRNFVFSYCDMWLSHLRSMWSERN
jgi:hypothetical protein